MSESGSERDIAAEVRAWLKANWDPQLSLIDWRLARVVVDADEVREQPVVEPVDGAEEAAVTGLG